MKAVLIILTVFLFQDRSSTSFGVLTFYSNDQCIDNSTTGHPNYVYWSKRDSCIFENMEYHHYHGTELLYMTRYTSYSACEHNQGGQDVFLNRKDNKCVSHEQGSSLYQFRVLFDQFCTTLFENLGDNDFLELFYYQNCTFENLRSIKWMVDATHHLPEDQCKETSSDEFFVMHYVDGNLPPECDIYTRPRPSEISQPGLFVRHTSPSCTGTEETMDTLALMWTLDEYCVKYVDDEMGVDDWGAFQIRNDGDFDTIQFAVYDSLVDCVRDTDANLTQEFQFGNDRMCENLTPEKQNIAKWLNVTESMKLPPLYEGVAEEDLEDNFSIFLEVHEHPHSFAFSKFCRVVREKFEEKNIEFVAKAKYFSFRDCKLRKTDQIISMMLLDKKVVDASSIVYDKCEFAEDDLSVIVTYQNEFPECIPHDETEDHFTDTEDTEITVDIGKSYAGLILIICIFTVAPLALCCVVTIILCYLCNFWRKSRATKVDIDVTSFADELGDEEEKEMGMEKPMIVTEDNDEIPYIDKEDLSDNSVWDANEDEIIGIHT